MFPPRRRLNYKNQGKNEFQSNSAVYTPIVQSRFSENRLPMRTEIGEKGNPLEKNVEELGLRIVPENAHPSKSVHLSSKVGRA